MQTEIVATGMGRAEGLTFDRAGNLFVCDMAGMRVLRVAADGTVATMAENGGCPNGMALAPDGTFIICNNGGFGEGREAPRMERMHPDGRLEVLFDAVDGEPVNALNDITFDEHGNFYCTDPQFPADGTVYTHICPPADVIFGRADGTLRRLGLSIRFPNGIAISPDGSTLIVAETQTRQLHAYAIHEPGVLGPARLFGELPTGYPDGMAYDEAGNLLVCGYGSGTVYVFAPEGGKPIGSLGFEDPLITNLCFGGPDMRRIFVAHSGTGRVVATEWHTPGMVLFPNR